MTMQSQEEQGDTLQLPDVQSGLLSEQALCAYLDELVATGVSVEVLAKDAQRGQARKLDLTLLSGALSAAVIHSAQLRYRYHGTAWVDTLMRVEGGTRIVRLDLDAVAVDLAPA